MSDSLSQLSEIIRRGLAGKPEDGIRQNLESLFGGRYHARHKETDAGGKSPIVRDAYGLASEIEGKEGVPFGALINSDNPPSGAYGGFSLAWFPNSEGSILTFVVGTRGLSPDEGILTRPGHRRRIAALRRSLARLDVDTWTKPDPSALGLKIPKRVTDRFSGFEKALSRYGTEIYCIARVPQNPENARKVVQTFFDLYAFERGWKPLQQYQPEYDAFHAGLRNDLFRIPTAREIYSLLLQRRFVVLQGPPGTGKTWIQEAFS